MAILSEEEEEKEEQEEEEQGRKQSRCEGRAGSEKVSVLLYLLQKVTVNGFFFNHA